VEKVYGAKVAFCIVSSNW